MLNVKETFLSYQGTGVNSGVAQYFVRLSGCTVKCPLRPNCDQPDSLDYSSGRQESVFSVVDSAIASVGKGGWLHITGGEPAEHPDFAALAQEAVSRGLQVQVQTSGSIPISKTSGVFLSVSPKQRAIHCCPSEIVLIACNWMTDDFAATVSEGHNCPIYVVPEATGGKFKCDRAIELTKTLSRLGRDARCGLQSHLIWEIR